MTSLPRLPQTPFAAALLRATLVCAALTVACNDTRRGPSLRDRVAAQAALSQAAATPSASSSAFVPVAAICTDTSEATAFRCADGVAMRSGDTLVLRLTNVGAAKRVDEPAEGANYRRYYYAGRFGGDNGTPAFHILDVRDSDGGAVELINAATGDSLLVRGVPILSPDGTRFAAVEEPDACDLATQLDVWRVTGDRPVREYSVQPFDCGPGSGWGPSDVAWRSRDTISLLRRTLPLDSLRSASGETDAVPALLVRVAGSWVLDTSSTARALAAPR